MGELCDDMIEYCIYEFNKNENRSRIKKNILDPCVEYLVNQFYPYIITTCIVFILTFILVIATFAMILRGGSSPTI